MYKGNIYYSFLGERSIVLYLKHFIVNMKYDLKYARELLGLQIKDIANCLGTSPGYAGQYEKEGEIPSKYVYLLWKRIPGLPIPEDFFYYTSFSLQVNMKYHKLTQTQIGKLFNIKNQSTISNYMAENIPMYEMKELFIKNFNPLIVPLQLTYEEDGLKFIPPTDLAERGLLSESYRNVSVKRGEKIKETFDKKRMVTAKNEEIG